MYDYMKVVYYRTMNYIKSGGYTYVYIVGKLFI